MCPIITKEEYDSCYFLIHKAYAYFFGYFDSKFHSFNSENYRIIENLSDKLYMFGYFTDDEKDKSSLRNIFKALKNTIRSDVFVEEVSSFGSHGGRCSEFQVEHLAVFTSFQIKLLQVEIQFFASESHSH